MFERIICTVERVLLGFFLYKFTLGCQYQKATMLLSKNFFFLNQLVKTVLYHDIKNYDEVMVLWNISKRALFKNIFNYTPSNPCHRIID